MVTTKSGIMSSNKKQKPNFDKLNKALIKLIVGCDLSFSTVERKEFKNFIAELNKPYSENLPSRKALSTTLLDDLYKEVLEKTKYHVPKDVCLLGDSWKNTSGKYVSFAIIMHNADGPPLFVDAFDMTTKPETRENLAEKVRFASRVENIEHLQFLPMKCLCDIKMLFCSTDL